MSKKGYSTGFAWFYGLITLFGLGVLYIVFNQVFVGNLVPIIKNQANETFLRGGMAAADLVTVNAGIDRYMVYFHILPYILFFVVVIYMVVAAIRKERESEFE